MRERVREVEERVQGPVVVALYASAPPPEIPDSVHDGADSEEGEDHREQEEQESAFRPVSANQTPDKPTRDALHSASTVRGHL